MEQLQRDSKEPRKFSQEEIEKLKRYFEAHAESAYLDGKMNCPNYTKGLSLMAVTCFLMDVGR